MPRCPINGCNEDRKHEQILCRHHWFRVPPKLRRRVWTLYQARRGSKEHRAAIAEAIEAVTPAEVATLGEQIYQPEGYPDDFE